MIFTEKSEPTKNCTEVNLAFKTSRNESIAFNCGGIAGQERFSGMRDRNYIGSDASIIMLGVTSPGTFRNVADRNRRFTSVRTIVLVGNKSDCKECRKVPSERVACYRKYGMQYFEISCMNRTKITLPFLSLARTLKNYSELEFF